MWCLLPQQSFEALRSVLHVGFYFFVCYTFKSWMCLIMFVLAGAQTCMMNTASFFFFLTEVWKIENDFHPQTHNFNPLPASLSFYNPLEDAKNM